MSHKADASFFDKKRPWSERKDKILGYYLEPYLAKIAHLNKPVLIVDGFAGPGKFGDGSQGSPLIILEQADRARTKRNAATIRCNFVEANPALEQQLAVLVGSRPDCSVTLGLFTNALSEIAQLAKTHSLFLYIDPYTVEGLNWRALDDVLQLVKQRDNSVELLLNFNVDSFCRRGRAALKLSPIQSNPLVPELEWTDSATPQVSQLDAIVGGDWWRSLLTSATDYPSAVDAVTRRFCLQLAGRFSQVCRHDVKELERHLVPKYVLIFCSRHPDTRVLMNDAMCKSRDLQAEREEPAESTLFEMRPEKLVPDMKKLELLVMEQMRKFPPEIRREDLVWKIVDENFCKYSSSEICRTVAALAKNGTISFRSPTGRLNPDAVLYVRV